MKLNFGRRGMNYREQKITIPKPTSFWGDITKEIKKTGLGILFMMAIPLSIVLAPLWVPISYAWFVGDTFMNEDVEGSMVGPMILGFFLMLLLEACALFIDFLVFHEWLEWI
jgi:hypothetical protein